MIFHATEIEGLVVIETKKFSDERGYFFESFHQEKFEAYIGRKFSFLQENESLSKKNVVRGLHFQKPPFAQGKLVSVIQGSVLDVAVDLRKNSPTFGQHEKVILTGEKKNQFWIPEGFAHGFVALEDNTIFCYKCTNYYHPESEVTILWNDRTLNIDWQIDNPVISDKDKNGLIFSDFESPF